MTQLDPADARCATGEYSLVPNEVASTGMTELVKERPTYGSAGPGQYVDYFVPLSYPADADSNLRFQVELMGDAYGPPDAVSLLIYTGDEIPSHRQTEIFADRAVDGIWSVLVNVAELSYQLKKAYAASGGSSNSSSNSSNSSKFQVHYIGSECSFHSKPYKANRPCQCLSWRVCVTKLSCASISGAIPTSRWKII